MTTGINRKRAEKSMAKKVPAIQKAWFTRRLNKMKADLDDIQKQLDSLYNKLESE
jgi:hypothetical protein